MNFENKLTIDIIEDILFRPEALATYLGEEVNIYLNDKLPTIEENTLININLQKANPIDYLFTKSAFGEFYDKTSNNPNLDILFDVNKSQQKHLLWGIMAYQDGNIHRTGNFEEDFTIKNFLKLRIDNEIYFLGKLTEIEKELLDHLTQNIKADYIKLLEQYSTKITPDDFNSAINKLKKIKFIYTDSQNGLYSIVHKINI